MDYDDLKITFATPYYISGFGIENRITDLAKNLPSNIIRQIVCLQQKRPAPRGIDVHSLPSIVHQSTAFKPLHFSACSKIIRNAFFWPHIRDSDIIDAQYFPMTYLPKSSKFIITWHSVTFPEFAENYRDAKIMDKEYLYMLKNMSRADLVIPVSVWAEKEIKKFNGSIPTKVVPNGVDLNKFRFKPIGKRGKTILSVGRLTPHKGHMEVILIFKRVLDELKESGINLLIVGSMNNMQYYESLKEYAESLGLRLQIQERNEAEKSMNSNKNSSFEKPHITILTNVPDTWMPFVYQLGDIFISCSHWEGFGMPMLEAQACGLPVLGYNMCSHPEVVANKNFLAEENDTWAIAENVKKLFTDNELYAKASIEARKFAEDLSWEKVTEQYLDVIQRL